MKTIITRTSEIKFTKTITREDRKTLEVSISKGSTEYSNACSDFHMKGVAIEVGNSITE